LKAPAEWIVPDWPVPAHVRALITTRAGGVSRGPYASFNLGELNDDAREAVSENKRRLGALLPGEPRWLRQVHGDRVVEADAVSGTVQADASYTRNPGTVCAVKIADCMPVLLSDRAGQTVAVAHAGWRGLSQGIVENTVRALTIDPANLYAEVAFRPLRAGKWLADLFELGRQRLARAGVTSVYGGGMCTVADPARFYSHRRDRITGRMAALIWMQGQG
jgi:copper oxidase (laccase) domain-containing protein